MSFSVIFGGGLLFVSIGGLGAQVLGLPYPVGIQACLAALGFAAGLRLERRALISHPNSTSGSREIE